jgi:outer membrane lipoprotein-sorting protein
MRRRWTIGLLAGLTVFAGTRGAEADEPSPLQILLKSFEPLDTTYSGEQVSEVQGAGRARPLQQVYRSGGVLRINYLRTGQVLLDDGKEQVFYLPRLNAYEKRPSELNRLARQAIVLRRQVRMGRVGLERLPDAAVAGRQAYVISVNNLRGKPVSRKVWIDQETYVQLGQEVTQPNGRTVHTYFRRIDFQETPPASVMAFTVPPGAQQVQRGHGRPIAMQEAQKLAAAWGGPLQPKFVPDGYTFRGFFRHDFNGREALVAVYGKPGAGTLSIFQGPLMGMSGMVEKKKNLRVLSARKGQADVMVVGPSGEQLEKVMGSL